MEDAGLAVDAPLGEVEFDIRPVGENVYPRVRLRIRGLRGRGARFVIPPLADSGYRVVRAAARIIRSIRSWG